VGSLQTANLSREQNAQKRQLFYFIEFHNPGEYFIIIVFSLFCRILFYCILFLLYFVLWYLIMIVLCCIVLCCIVLYDCNVVYFILVLYFILAHRWAPSALGFGLGMLHDDGPGGAPCQEQSRVRN
jgi:hypothetical protein